MQRVLVKTASGATGNESGHAFQRTYAALIDKLIEQEKLNRCHGCSIQHPSQNQQHSCLMMNIDDAWMYFHDEVAEQIDLN